MPEIDKTIPSHLLFKGYYEEIRMFLIVIITTEVISILLLLPMPINILFNTTRSCNI